MSATDPAVAAFLDQLRAQQNASPATLTALQSDLALLCRLAGDTPWQNMRSAHIRSYAARAHQAGRSPVSVKRILSSWRRFLGHLAERGETVLNAAQGVRAPRTPGRLPRALTPEEAGVLLDSATKDVFGVRDAAMFETAYSSGLRVAELTHLDCADVDFSGGLIRVQRGKGGKERIVPVGGKALDALHVWLAMRSKWGVRTDGPLFVNRKGGRLTERSVQLRVRKLAARAGLAMTVTPHMLRHSCASHLLQSSGDLRAVQEILGHSDVSSTQIYTHLDYQALAKVFDRAHPRARRKRGPQNAGPSSSTQR